MQRVAMAVLAECEGELLVREDFEELLTYLKVRCDFLPRDIDHIRSAEGCTRWMHAHG